VGFLKGDDLFNCINCYILSSATGKYIQQYTLNNDLAYYIFGVDKTHRSEIKIEI
jgi:hypothetical protein